MLVDVASALGITGRQAEDAVRRCGITLNRNPIPFDPNGPWYTSGLRFGTPAVTTLGMGPAEMNEIAAVVALVLRNIVPGTTKSGGKDKTKYTLDDAASRARPTPGSKSCWTRSRSIPRSTCRSCWRALGWRESLRVRRLASDFAAEFRRFAGERRPSVRLIGIEHPRRSAILVAASCLRSSRSHAHATNQAQPHPGLRGRGGNGPLGQRLRRADGQPDGHGGRSLPGLSPKDQAEKAIFAFDSPERLNWHFIPRDRLGLPIKELTSEQRALAFGLISTGLGGGGYLKATTIMSLEQVLQELEQGKGPVRDPERYFLTIFGTPSDQGQVGLAGRGASPLAQLHARGRQDRGGHAQLLRLQPGRGPTGPAPGPAHPGRPRGHGAAAGPGARRQPEEDRPSSRPRPPRRSAPPARPSRRPTPRPGSLTPT